MQRKEFLRSTLPFEAGPAAFLLPGWAIRLFDQRIAAGRRNHLDMLNTVEHRNFFEWGRPIAPQLIGVDSLWHVIFPINRTKKAHPRWDHDVPNVQHGPPSSTALQSQYFRPPTSTHRSSRDHRA
ncbi:hypothetical protein HNQ08_002841 [Deinococcus humi]|uniref:Uncharacterized protein n=1 Tax=Deinococcus humi TaxID=662880 RepID=A0A7W8NFI2_9DEIO|nr:hypothetical protein [Deinococcus humi]